MKQEKPMKLARAVTLVAAMAIVCGLPKPAEADDGFSFGYYGPGYSFQPGHYPRHIYDPHIYRPYHYYWNGPSRKTRRYSSSRHSSKNAGRCTQWSQTCTTNWGSKNADYRGCMRYHRCS